MVPQISRIPAAVKKYPARLFQRLMLQWAAPLNLPLGC
jgi:hypothetical protein